MIVADLIVRLQACDPQALVLIPRDAGLGEAGEIAADITPVPAARFTSGPAATRGAVQLVGLLSPPPVLAVSGELQVVERPSP